MCDTVAGPLDRHLKPGKFIKIISHVNVYLHTCMVLVFGFFDVICKIRFRCIVSMNQAFGNLVIS